MKLAVVSLFLVLGAIAPAIHAGPEDDYLAGMRLEAKEVGELEKNLASHPDDLSLHARLLGYYGRLRLTSSSANAPAVKHMLWIIRNHPEADLGLEGLTPTGDPSAYGELKQAWLDQVSLHPRDARVAGHAGKYFLVFDRVLAEKLLKEAQELDPHDPDWSEELGRLYALDEGRDAAIRALAQLERARADDTSETSRMYRLDALAMTAFEAGDVDKASGYASDLLAAARKLPKDWDYGNAIHHGNIVLGRIALKRGDVKLAEDYLLKAGGTPGSPQLDSFGPNMSLARDLLAAGDKEVVLQYFRLCGKFWADGGATLDAWARQVKAGQMPEFGASLVY
ncbi:MAG TPA: hypothetical protein VGH80_08255 [Xanthomonadaceae bacterium]|jgi:tetratricopeptide (TPR) repeat protein